MLHSTWYSSAEDLYTRTFFFQKTSLFLIFIFETPSSTSSLPHLTPNKYAFWTPPSHIPRWSPLKFKCTQLLNRGRIRTETQRQQDSARLSKRAEPRIARLRAKRNWEAETEEQSLRKPARARDRQSDRENSELMCVFDRVKFTHSIFCQGRYTEVNGEGESGGEWERRRTLLRAMCIKVFMMYFCHTTWICGLFISCTHQTP